jgi:hypothetical protein
MFVRVLLPVPLISGATDQPLTQIQPGCPQRSGDLAIPSEGFRNTPKCGLRASAAPVGSRPVPRVKRSIPTKLESPVKSKGYADAFSVLPGTRRRVRGSAGQRRAPKPANPTALNLFRSAGYREIGRGEASTAISMIFSSLIVKQGPFSDRCMCPGPRPIADLREFSTGTHAAQFTGSRATAGISSGLRSGGEHVKKTSTPPKPECRMKSTR